MIVCNFTTWDTVKVGEEVIVPNAGKCIKEASSLARRLDGSFTFVHQFSRVCVPTET